jgi:hypothetical protein
MVNTLVKALDKCGQLHTINRKCGESSMDLVKSVAGITASSGEVVTHCVKKDTSPCGTVAPPLRRLAIAVAPGVAAKDVLSVAKCAVNLKDSMKYLILSLTDIAQMQKECKEGKDGCVENVESLVSALAGLGKYVAGVVGKCVSIPQDLGCEGAVATLVHDLAEVSKAAQEMSVQCELPNHGKGPKHVTEVVKVPNPESGTIAVDIGIPVEAQKLYEKQVGDVAPTGVSPSLILAALLPVTAIVSFVGGRFLFASGATRPSSVRGLMVDTPNEAQIE